MEPGVAGLRLAVSAAHAAGWGSHGGADAPFGLKPNGGAEPDHGIGTRQPSRPLLGVTRHAPSRGPAAPRRAGPRPRAARAPRPGRRTLRRAGRASAAPRRARAGGRDRGRPAGRRGRPSRRTGRPSCGRAYRDTSRTMSWLDRTQVGGAPTASWAPSASSIDRAQRVGPPRRQQEVEVEGGVQLVRAHVQGQALGLWTHASATNTRGGVVGVGERAPAPGRSRARRRGPSADGRRARRSAAARSSRAMSGSPCGLHQAVRDVDPEPVDAAVKPEPDRLLEVGPDLRVGPVEIGLLGGEQVQVPLARAAVGLGDPLPGRPPKLLRQSLGGRSPSVRGRRGR